MKRLLLFALLLSPVAFAQPSVSQVHPAITTVMSQSTITYDPAGQQLLVASREAVRGSTVMYMLSAHAAQAVRNVSFVMPIPPTARFTGKYRAPGNARVTYSTDDATFTATPMQVIAGRQTATPVQQYTSVRFELAEFPQNALVNFSVETVVR